MNKNIKSLFPSGLAGLIYDCDGVMIDSAAANRSLYNTILAALDLPQITPAQEKYAFQATFQQALRMLVPPALHDRLEDVCQNAINYDRDVLPKIKLMPGYRTFIDKSAKANLKQAIDTNRTELGIYKVLDFFNLPNYFDPVVSSSMAEPKPAPEGVKLIASAWQTEPRQILFVGDSPDDREAAKSGGAIFAGFGGIDGDIKVNTWDELASLLFAEEN